MNVYDFDKTIYDGDSTVDFWLWSLLRDPSLARFAPRMLVPGLRLAFGRAGLGDFKQAFFSFISGIDDLQAEVARFWLERQGKLKGWYLAEAREDDVVISASPEFLLRPICEALGVQIIATKVDTATGRFITPNCKGQEKVRRFRELHPDDAIECFYSDSHSDDPLAAIAESAWLVRGDVLRPWA